MNVMRPPGGRRLRILIPAVAPAGTAAAIAVSASGTASAAPGSAPAAVAARSTLQVKPTVVLVHGGFADGSNWNGVIERLTKDGFPVIAPANPLRGITNDATYISSLLKSIKGPIILVGHSYGGAVITNAAAGNPN